MFAVVQNDNTTITKAKESAPLLQFRTLVDWVKGMIVAENAPGLMMGISGTDSILAFLICSKAFEELGRGDRVVGIHYGAAFPPPDKSAEDVEKIVTFNPSYRWVARVIVPWLQEQAPKAQVIVESDIDYTDDYQRWASLFKSSLSGAMKTEPLPEGSNYWVVGTRNATEAVLGSYSNVSGAVSVQPLLRLWKSDVLNICKALGVPQMAIDKSRQVDCDCGRFDIAADHIEEVDAVLKERAGLISKDDLEMAIEPGLLQKLRDFVEGQINYAGFKKNIPYTPPSDMI